MVGIGEVAEPEPVAEGNVGEEVEELPPIVVLRLETGGEDAEQPGIARHESVQVRAHLGIRHDGVVRERRVVVGAPVHGAS